MSNKLRAILAAVLVSLLGLMIWGSRAIDTAAYTRGLRDGVSAVVEQCAHHDSTIYNGDTGDVMVCSGGHMSAPEKAPEKAVPEPPEAIPGAPQHGSIPDHMEDEKKVENI